MLTILKLLNTHSLRNSSYWWHITGFFLLFLLLLPLTGDGRIEQDIAISVILIAVWVATINGGSDFFTTDYKCGALEVSLYGVLHPLLLILIKVLHHWLASVVVLLPLISLGAVLYNLPLHTSLMLLLVVVVGLLPASFLLAFGNALLLNAKRGPLLMPVLIFPLLIATIVFAAHTVLAFITGNSLLFPLSVLFLQAMLHILLTPWCILFALRTSVSHA